MALPSFEKIWASHEHEESRATTENFFLLGSTQSTGRHVPPPMVRRPVNYHWFSQDFMESKYSCCEKQFDTSEQLEKHKKEHVKCFTKDCDFMAHPDVIEKHFNLHHRNSLYRRLCLTNNPDDVAKWVSERKKNFPTQKKVEEKRQEEERRRARGQVIEKKEFGLMRRRGRGGRGQPGDYGRGGRGQPGDCGLKRGRGRGAFGRGQRGRGARFNPRFRGRGGPPMKAAKLEGEAYLRPGQDPLACLPGAVEREEEEKEDEEEDERPVEMSSKAPPGALSLIASCYDSDDSDEEEDEQEIVKANKQEEGRKSKEETTAPAADPRPPPVLRSSDGRWRDPVLRLMRQRERCMENKRRLLTRPRLLEMLLARDIQRERNILMQCCYYIAKRNFFERQQEKAAPRVRPTSSRKTKACNDEVWDDDGVL